jgi:large subunit ribosomal protein L33
MAKKKGGRETVALDCTECNNQNYITTRNKVNMEGKLTLKKYCKHCRKRTLHKERAKLK